MSVGSETPSYLSAHTAEVILSDIRPIKLRPDALRCINVLLDELLWSILTVAQSLHTDRLNSGLRKVLPTSLGKEALLEAEVELRAYQDRTKAAIPPREAAQEFQLQYSYELLRLKCEAYSTLSDADEDADAEARLHARMGGVNVPAPALVAPAALYLTAMIECICEHILSIVGRVASRDSSRTTADVQDLFCALCEDTSMFGLFRTMKVYEQIEKMTGASADQRNRPSALATEKAPSRATSPLQDPPGSPRPLSLIAGTMATHARAPSESAAAPRKNGTSREGSPSFARASVDTAKALRTKLSNGRVSNDVNGKPDSPRDGLHARSDSVLSDMSDDSSVQDFDDLMRSGSTMKMSLTPDRLKTMELFHKERSKRAKGRGSKLASKDTSLVEEEDPSQLLAPPLQAHRSLRRPSAVDAILEDEEEPTPAPTRARQQSVSTPRSEPTNALLGRSRSISAAASPSQERTSDSPSPPPAPPPKSAARTASLRSPDTVPSTPITRTASAPASPVVSTARRTHQTLASINVPRAAPPSAWPGGMPDDDDASDDPEPAPPRTPKTPVSRATRDLMAFLADGPPEDPPGAPRPKTGDSVRSSASKGGRLTRMMQRLTSRASSETLSSQQQPPPVRAPAPVPPPMLSNASRTTVGAATIVSLPRAPPPRVLPLSPPDSPSETSLSEKQQIAPAAPVPAPAPAPAPAKQQAAPPAPAATIGPMTPPASVPATATSATATTTAGSTRIVRRPSAARKAVPAWPNGEGPRERRDTSETQRSGEPMQRSTSQTTQRSADPKQLPTPAPSVATAPDLSGLRAAMAHARSAEECRLLLDAVLGTVAMPLAPPSTFAVPSPSGGDVQRASMPVASLDTSGALERSVVEFFLGEPLHA